MQSAVRTGPTHGAVASVASTGAATCSADGRCPALSAQERKARALPDLFLPADGSKSLGYMPLNTPGKGVGVALDGERAGASFKTQELMDHLYGGSKSLARRRMLLAALENDPVMRKWDGIFQSRSERLRRAREKGAALVEHMKRLGVTDGTEISLMSSHLGDLLPSDLHRSMFVPTLLSQASDEQQKEWLGPAQDFKILGTYVQTELGHGSFVRGLETTATFDPSTDEFVCHSPTLTATKWWPGNLGQVTTHCILMAKLVSNGVDHGVHAFLMPLRDPKNGLAVLPGRTIGDIGPKVGYESNDNGFARFDHVRIPRSYLMARYVRVNRDGSYERLGHPKAAYATMVFVRSQIVIYAARYLTMGLTIAIRYSAVRRQFPDPASGKGASGVNAEMAVLNYQPQQHTLFTLLATAFAFHYSGLRMRRLYEQNKANLAKGDASLLAELHATSSGLKAYTTTVTSEGLEATRKCCGGHGYSRMCGISDIWVDYVPAQTYEGDNVVMFLQTARALVKSFGAVQKGKFKPRETSQLAYMAEALAMQKAGGEAAAAASGARSGLTAEHLRGGVENGEALDTQLRALFAHRAARLLVVAVEELAESGKARPEWNGEQHWEACKIALVAAARSHCQNVLLLNFLDALKRFQSPDAKHAPSAQLQKVLRRLSDLHALSIIEKELGDFSVDGYLSLAQARLVRRRIVSLLSEIRPDAVALVDSFDYSDWFLNSALGRFDGDVYSTMWEWAQRNPLNDRQANGKGPGIDEFIMPMLKAKAKL